MTIYLYEMFIKIADSARNDTLKESYPIHESENTTDKIHLACSYITEHCSKNLTLDDVSSYVGFSPCHFSRHFKKVTTHSFVEYLTLQRINKFQIYLADNSLSITDAAYLAGFKSISSLNRVFSKYCGCSPREFRKYYN